MYTVFDLHCDTADRLAWQSLPSDLKTASGMDFYGPGDENAPELCRDLKRNHCHISLEGIGDTPWAHASPAIFQTAISARQSFEVLPTRSVAYGRADRPQRRPRRLGNRRRKHPAILDSGRVAAVRTIENARFFALDPAYVDKAALGGVLMASLSWNAAGPLASGHDTAEGLTRRLRRIEAHGSQGDGNRRLAPQRTAASTRSHLPRTSRWSQATPTAAPSAERRATLPMRSSIAFASAAAWWAATSAAAFSARAASPRSMTSPAHIDRWLERDGEDAIALGSDFDGCDTPRCIASAADMPAFQNLLRAALWRNHHRQALRAQRPSLLLAPNPRYPIKRSPNPLRTTAR